MFFFLLTFFGSFSGVSAQKSSSMLNVSPASSSLIVPGNSAYNYIGCYNETTGDSSVGKVRALSGGSMVGTSSPPHFALDID